MLYEVITLSLAALLVAAVIWWLRATPPSLPASGAEGTILSHAIPLQPFSLTDQDGKPFTLERTVKAGMPDSFQSSYRGRVLDVAFYPVPDEAGTVAKVAVYVKDVTERIQAEQALEQRAAQYRRIVETVNEGILGLDARNNFV